MNIKPNAKFFFCKIKGHTRTRDNCTHRDNTPYGIPRKIPVKCPSCKIEEYARKDCFTRKNTPYCQICLSYGHENDNCIESETENRKSDRKSERPLHRCDYTQNGNKNHQQGIKGNEKCIWCQDKGHNINNCLAKTEYEKLKGNLMGPRAGQ